MAENIAYVYISTHMLVYRIESCYCSTLFVFVCYKIYTYKFECETIYYTCTLYTCRTDNFI